MSSEEQTYEDYLPFKPRHFHLNKHPDRASVLIGKLMEVVNELTTEVHRLDAKLQDVARNQRHTK